MKVRSSVKPICEKCKIIKRKGPIFIIDLDRAYGRLLVDTMTKRFSKIIVVERSDRVRLGESPNQLVTIGRTINRPKRTHTQRKL